MSTNGTNRHENIAAELKAVESLIENGTDRNQLHQRVDQVQHKVDDVADPVLGHEFRRQPSALRGK